MAGIYRLMLHFNENDASTFFIDEKDHPFTRYGTAQIDTAQFKFGTASGLFASGDYIDTPDSPDFNMSGAEFCMDCRIRLSSLPAAASGYTIASQGIGEADHWSFWVYELAGNYWLGFRVQEGGGTVYNNSAIVPLTTGVWHHVATTMKSELGGYKSRIFFDNIMVGEEFQISGVVDKGGTFKIGKNAGATVWNYAGWIDEFRFITGDYVWDNSFTDPPAQYDEGKAVLLLDFNPCDLIVDGNYIYACGNKISGITNYRIVEAIDITTNPFTVVATYSAPAPRGDANSNYYDIKKVGNSLFLCGTRLNKPFVQRLDLTTPTTFTHRWYWVESGALTVSGCAVELDVNDYPNIYVTGSYNNASPTDVAFWAKLTDIYPAAPTQVWFKRSWTDFGQHSWARGIQNYSTYIDVFGNLTSGNRVINRINKADGTIFSTTDLGDRYLLYQGCLLGGSYFVGSIYNVSPSPAYDQSIAKIDQAALTHADTSWDFGNDNVFTENLINAVTDGLNVYGVGTTGATGPPLFHTLVYVSMTTGGVPNWGIPRNYAKYWTGMSSGFLGIPAGGAIGIKGDFLIIGFWREQFGTNPSEGYIEVRKKSDGSLATYEEFVTSDPTMDQLMRNGKWFSSGIFQGFWLGWR